jgi:hypothetical protein
MIDKPFTISDHLLVKVCYTLDTPYRNANREQLAEYILAVACDGKTSFTLAEWDQILETILGSSLTVGEWLNQREVAHVS